MSGQSVGYIRVSSVQQNSERQLSALTLDKIFEDKASGKHTHRPALQACLNHLREGDCLHIDRLARNLLDLQKIISELVTKGVTVIFHKENITFSVDTNPMQALMFQMLGAFAEFERSLIRERQREGIEAAKNKRGVKFGAPPKLSGDQIAALNARLATGAGKKQVAKEFNISRPTLYKAIAQTSQKN